MKKLFLLMVIALLVLAVGVSAATITVNKGGQAQALGTVTGGGSYPNTGGTVQLTATASTGAGFTSWSGGACFLNNAQCTCRGITTPCIVPRNTARTITANFGYLLTVTKTGTGTVTTPFVWGATRINCGATCSRAYTSATTVTLEGSEGVQWTGCTPLNNPRRCTVLVNQARPVTATFTAGAAGGGATTITVNKGGQAQALGTVTGGGSYPNTGGTVQLTATASTGAGFTSWSGGACFLNNAQCTCRGITTPCIVPRNTARTITANFGYLLTVTKTGTGTVTTPFVWGATRINCGATCSRAYTSATTVTLEGSEGVQWTGCTPLNNPRRCTVLVNQARPVTATFAAPPVTLFRNTQYSPPATKQVVSQQDVCVAVTPTLRNQLSSLKVTSGNVALLYDAQACPASEEPKRVSRDVPDLASINFNDRAESVKVVRVQCGDRFVDGAEVCDPTDTATQYSTQGCAPTAEGYATGKECNGAAAGQNACKGYGQCVATERCGDGILNGPEQCDGTNLGTPAATCLDQGFSGGTLGCHPAGTASQCQFNTQQCVVKLTVVKTGSGVGYVTVTAVSPSGAAVLGTSCVSDVPGGACTAYPPETRVTLTPVAAAESSFKSWVAGCPGSVQECMLTLSTDTQVAAEFERVYTLTVTKAGTGAGTVSYSPGGPAADGGCVGADCISYEEGTTVVLTASPADGSEVESWGGACEGTPAEQGTCDVEMTMAKTVTVTFKPRAFCGDGVIQTPNNDGVDEECDGTNINEQTCELQGFSGGSLRCSLSCSLDTTACTYRLAVAKEGSGSGTVSTSGAGIMCGADCDGDYTPESTVTLSAQAAAGSRFTGWSGACSGTGQCTVKMDAEKTVIAAFELLPDLEVADAYWDVAGAQVTSGTLGDEATPVAVIRNGGGGIAEDFKVSIEIYKGTTNKRTEMSSETYSLAPGEEQIIDFSAPYRFTELGDFDIKVWVDSTPAKPGSVIETNEDNNIRTTRKAGATGITAVGIADRSMTIEPACGDGAVNGNEQCDGGTQQCLADGYSGEQACTPAGSIGECTWAACAPTESCGDGILNGPERNPGGCDFGQNNDDATTSRTAGIYTDFVEPGYEQQATAFYCSASCESRQETVVGPRCGDGAVTDAEVCDGAEVGGESCVSQGFIDGPLECSADCTAFDTSQCISQVCGNGAVEGTEACDDGNEADGDYCSGTCNEVTGSCGDSVQQSNEACDDGNEVTETQCTEYGGQGDFCSADCSQQVTFECPRCGDGQVAEGYEACDDGNTETEACAYGEQSCTVCSAACQEEAGAFSYCGDSNTDTVNGEECDNGLDLNGQVCVADYGGQSCSYCTAECKTAVETAPRLGDGQINGDEACDPAGAGVENDVFPAGWDNCGSLGFVADTGYLRCDENGDIEPVCTLCGNGAIDVSETCDGTNFGTATCESEGFAGGGDLTCSPTSCQIGTRQCVAQVCGNGVTEGTEACDSDSKSCTVGGYGGTESCNAQCTGYNDCVSSESCGDNVAQGNEICDGTDLKGESCDSQGFPLGGDLACNPTCSAFDTSLCTSTPACTPNWQPSEWSPDPCTAGSTQTRTYTDSQGCGTIDGKPADETRTCAVAAQCGNGVVEAGEDCEGDASQQCTIFGNNGMQFCNQCRWDECLDTSISGVLFEDTNANGVFDSGEPTVAGKIVHITRESDNSLPMATAQTTTDSSGRFSLYYKRPSPNGANLNHQISPTNIVTIPISFSTRVKDIPLPKGTYVVAAQCGNGVVEKPGEKCDDGTTNGQRLYRCNMDCTSMIYWSMGAVTWIDNDGDGENESTDNRIGDVEVSLLTAAGSVIETKRTSSAGEALFLFQTNPGNAQYKLRFAAPDGYAFTIKDAQFNSPYGPDAFDSDADQTTGETDAVNLNTVLAAGFVSIGGTDAGADEGTGVDTAADSGAVDVGGEPAADEGTGEAVYACEPTMPGYTDDGAFQWADNDYDEDGALDECDPFDSNAGCDFIEECVDGGWQTYS